MLFFKPSHIVPKHLKRIHLLLRIALSALLLGVGFVLFVCFVFPGETFSYERGAKADENTLPRPTVSNGTPLKNGLLVAGDRLLAYAGIKARAEKASFSVTLENDSPRPQNLTLSLRKSYRAFFLPNDEPITAPENGRAVIIDDKPYLWKNEGEIIPFINMDAALSRFDRDQILPADKDLLRIFPPKDAWIGFRTGTLLADEQSVYLVTGEHNIRPFGSDDILEALGYGWNRIIKINDNELAMYKIGKLLRFDSIQPDGTLFHDTNTDSFYEIRDGTRRLIKERAYRDFLLSRTDAIEVNSKSLKTTLSCVLENNFFSRRTYSCTIPLSNLEQFPGKSYEIAIDAPTDIRVRTLRARFKTEISIKNLLPLLRDLREQIAKRYND